MNESTTQSAASDIVYVGVGVVIGTVIVLLSIAVIIAFIVLVVFKRKRTTVSLGDSDNQYPHRNMTMSPDVKAEVPQYSEITPLQVPRAVKVTTLPQPVQLQHNPMYDSSECLIDMPLAKSKSVDTFDSALLSEFNIYAIPDRQQPPPVPPYRGTPDSESRPVYNEKIDPSMFQNSSSLGSSVEVHPYSSIYADPEQIDRTDILEVTEKNIVEIKELGVGQFGEVVLAHTVGISLMDLRLSNTSDTVGISILVAVKKLKSGIDEATRIAFEKEIKFMAKLRHENVVRLLGVCLEKQAFIIMEYMENGDLNQYLKKHQVIDRDIYPLPEGTLSVPILIHICLQVASGLRYLASHKCIHRDLATRNCLVGQKNTVKIADFGMSRNLYSSVYYQVQGKAMLPIRWMSNECFYGRFSEKTDIWAFGVTMWEIFTLCRDFPYPELSDQEVIDNAIKDYNRVVPKQPSSCPSDVYHIMLRCWINDPEDRADFEEVYNLLAQIHAYSDI